MESENNPPSKLSIIVFGILSTSIGYIVFWLLPKFVADYFIEQYGGQAKYELLEYSFIALATYLTTGFLLSKYQKYRAPHHTSVDAEYFMNKNAAIFGFLIIIPLIAAFFAGANLLPLLGIIVALGVYFAPALIARHRKHHNLLAIFFTNLFLGWTIIGWVISIIWAGTTVKNTE